MKRTRMFQFRGLADSGPLGEVAALGELGLWRPDAGTTTATLAPNIHLDIGSRGADVMFAQQALRDAGVITWLPTGQFDLATHTAVAQYQKKYGITEPAGVGVVGPTTWSVMHGGGGDFHSSGLTLFGGGTVLTERPTFNRTPTIDPVALKAAQDKAAADKAAADAAQAVLDAAKKRNAGQRGDSSGLVPPDLQRAKEAVDATKAAAAHSQAQLEQMSVGARLGAALRWAGIPLAAGAILMGFGYKKTGSTALVVGTGLGFVRFFKKPTLDEQYPEET